MALKQCSSTIVFDNEVVITRSGTTAERNALIASTGLVQGATWWNTSSESFEIYDGVNWIETGPPPYDKGQVWSWGSNGFAQLGDNTTTNRSSPVSTVGGFTNFCQVAAGQLHSQAVRQSGTAWGWGAGFTGRLGTNNEGFFTSPVSVVGGFCDWCQITAAQGSLAVRQNGTAWGWGVNGDGQIGDNTTTNRSSPVSVVGGFTDWSQVSTGSFHSIGLRQNGTVWAWGFGRGLGDNTTTNKSSPVSVVGGFTNWCQVKVGSENSFGIRQTGTLWGWGLNGGAGRLGVNNTTFAFSSPVSVVGGFTDWCQVGTVGPSGVAVRQNGTAWAWGYNNFGQLGDNTTTNRSSPVSVIGGFTDWCQVSAGEDSMIGIRQNGTAWTWGRNCRGELGTNDLVSRSSPVSVVGGFTDWCQASVGGYQNFVLAIRQLN